VHFEATVMMADEARDLMQNASAAVNREAGGSLQFTLAASWLAAVPLI
jgi:hypothetical protein